MKTVSETRGKGWSGVIASRLTAVLLVLPAMLPGAGSANTGEARAGMAADAVEARRAFASAGSAHELRPLFGTLDSATFRARMANERDDETLPFALAGIGFPHVEREPAASRRNARRFEPMLDWHGASRDERRPIARIRCMNLPSHVVDRRAARFIPIIERLAARHDLDPLLVRAVVARESCFDPAAVSHAGAQGLMQLMPATARWLKVRDPHRPEANLAGGIAYLAQQLERFGDVTLALAAYNAGPGNVRRYNGVPPFSETRQYIEKVLSYRRRYAAAEMIASL